MSEAICPVCAGKVYPFTEQRSVQVRYGPLVNYYRETFDCDDCGESGAYVDDSNAINLALAVSRSESIETMLTALACSVGLNMKSRSDAYIERALGLKQRTLRRWRVGESVTEGEYALLRLLILRPALIEDIDRDDRAWREEKRDFHRMKHTEDYDETEALAHETMRKVSLEEECKPTPDPK